MALSHHAIHFPPYHFHHPRLGIGLGVARLAQAGGMGVTIVSKDSNTVKRLKISYPAGASIAHNYIVYLSFLEMKSRFAGLPADMLLFVYVLKLLNPHY